MEFTEPLPFQTALDRVASKTPIAADLSSAEWQQLQLGLRDRAFFSAHLDLLNVVSGMQVKIDAALSAVNDPEKAFMDRSKFIAEMRDELGATPGDSGKLTDITSTNRLGLIYDFQIEDAQEFGRWKAAQDPAIRDEFPAMELVRITEPKGGPQARRDWASRWADAGGQFFGDRMIALRDDPIWTKISRFGRPWPPFDYNSGMGVEDIDRSEAEALGLIGADASIPETETDFNQGLQASLPNASPDILEGFKEVFGDQVAVQDGKIVWKGTP